MNHRYAECFQDMKRDLKRVRRGARDPLWTFLQQAAIARAYRSRLPLPGLDLTQVAYFKEHLPRFEAEVQYYNLRYEAERCRPEKSDRAWAGFWSGEMPRMTQQAEAEPELYAYFLGGSTDRDEEFFGGDPAAAEKMPASGLGLLRSAGTNGSWKRSLVRFCPHDEERGTDWLVY